MGFSVAYVYWMRLSPSSSKVGKTAVSRHSPEIQSPPPFWPLTTVHVPRETGRRVPLLTPVVKHTAVAVGLHLCRCTAISFPHPLVRTPESEEWQQADSSLEGGDKFSEVVHDTSHSLSSVACKTLSVIRGVANSDKSD